MNVICVYLIIVNVNITSFYWQIGILPLAIYTTGIWIIVCHLNVVENHLGYIQWDKQHIWRYLVSLIYKKESFEFAVLFPTKEKHENWTLNSACLSKDNIDTNISHTILKVIDSSFHVTYLKMDCLYVGWEICIKLDSTVKSGKFELHTLFLFCISKTLNIFRCVVYLIVCTQNGFKQYISEKQWFRCLWIFAD